MYFLEKVRGKQTQNVNIRSVVQHTCGAIYLLIKKWSFLSKCTKKHMQD